MQLRHGNPAARVAALYVAAAGLYVLVSYPLLALLVSAPDVLVLGRAALGVVFVAATAALLYLERKRSDRRSRYLTSVVDSAQAAILGATTDGTITSWNRGAEELYGYTAAEVCGRSATILHPPECARDLSYILDRVRTGAPIRGYETLRLRKDGSRIPITLIVSPIRDAGGNVVGLSSIAHDISERKRAEKALQMAEVGQLASGLVHEIRNPLNAMRMQIAVIQDSLETPGDDDLRLARSQLERLEGEVLRVQKLANNFLAYGRPARDKPEHIDLPALLASVADFVRPEFARVGATISLETAPLAVVMDRDKLRQILVNIAENARQAMPAGGALTVTCDRAPGEEVRLRLRDSGCGIDADRLPHIFDAFVSTKDEGTGLGLAIVKKTVETAGGSVTAESRPGEGTTIEILLPAAGPASSTETAPATAAEEGSP